ncbi:DEAD/DEAH box helicase [Leptodesmis sichuanensis]|uniref:DEAD/DEAH box helicase n=1 Tax=Leptodesmis sichuanensis TaxID=2906798 RepID=UPI001F2932EA|nr:DEAD/DEAH box helicase [Leptodesmis sichuanensis]UIE37947.1 DEAD/DEAH box helicase [Leptodesmis sichuanensis A121]
MTLSFHSLGLSETRTRHLEQLGFTTPTPIQAQAIPHLLSGRDVVGQAQTGTGKTAAFSLPILERIDIKSNAVQALILTPTRELALQVCQAIRSFIDDRRLKVVTLYGGQAIETQIGRLQRGAQIVVGTPGRILDLLSRGDLKLNQVNWLVLDEADEMLNMGFIQDVEKILSQAPTERQTAFFSATMDPSIRKLVTKFLRSPVTVTIEQPKAAPTRINQVAYIIPRGWTKARALLPILELEDPDSALIFVRTRKSAAELTSQLQAAGHSVDEYHGDLSQTQRERLLLRLRQRQVRWVVATDIAARGIHVDDLTHVINYDLPDSVENYVHRIGRTGRAGKEGTAISIIHPLDRRKLRDIEHHIRQRLAIASIPTRAQIEARQLEKLQAQLKEALAGERMASFLPIVAQLSEEYEPHAIAAAALQMAYDQTRPSWMRTSQDAADYADEVAPRYDSPRHSSGPKPKPVKRQAKTGNSSQSKTQSGSEVSSSADR